MDPVISGATAGIVGVGAEKAYDGIKAEYEDSKHQTVCIIGEDGSLDCNEEELSVGEAVSRMGFSTR
jgi:hypothetical protein